MEIHRKDKQESGQVLVLIAIGFIVLLGFTALAIDGGMVYSDRRQAQNTADAAALAGALEKAQGQLDPVAVQKAEAVLTVNDYDPASAAISVSQDTDIDGAYFQVQVDLTSTTQLFFAHLFGFSDIQNRVTAVAKTRGGNGGPLGAAIIAMGDCTAGDPTLLNSDGGGNSGGILAFGGDIFANSPDPVGGHCSINPPNSTNSWGIRAMDGYKIYSVGAYSYSTADKMSPVPIEKLANGGVRIGDPLSFLPEPQCTSNGSITNSGGTKIYHPGRFGGHSQPNFDTNDKVWLEPGIYCISGVVSMSGNAELKGDGVVLYIMDSDFSFRGNGDLELTAPTEDNCLGTEGQRSASCTYKGMVFFMARGLHQTIDIRGNGMNRVTGTVYALDGDVGANGGGHDADDWVVKGQIIARSIDGSGNGSFVVQFNDDSIYHGVPFISLTK